jgi:TRAP-type C4-dicarboxylate transport system permease small subunit
MEGRRYSLVLERQRHLKWRWLDPVEQGLMVLCGLTLAGFSCTVFFDVVTRSLGHPVLWVQEVTTTFFVYGIFIGTAAAARRNDHL